MGQRDLADHVAWGAAGVFAAIAWMFGWMSTLPMVLMVGAAAINTWLAIYESRWLRRLDPRTLDALDDFMTLRATDPDAALRMLQEYFRDARQRDLREYLDLNRRAVSDPWAAMELVKLLKSKVELITYSRRDVSRKNRRLRSGVEKLRRIDRVDALTRRALAEAKALAERARLNPPNPHPPSGI